MNTSKKTCFKCGKTLPIAEFYRHSQMADGHLNKCKTCTKKDAASNRSENIESIRERDRRRNNLPHRVAARAKYRTTPEYAVSHHEACRRYSEKHAERRAAQLAIGSALRSGKVEKQPCFICGSEKVEAHHPDYLAPLDVVWLCGEHHKQIHTEIRNKEYGKRNHCN